MPFTSWKSWSSGEILTAADMNTYVRDNGRWLSHGATGGAPTARVHNSASFAGIASGTNLTFDSERWDIGPMHDPVSNPERLTVPSGGGGLYLVGGHVRLTSVYDGSGAGEVGIGIYHNGSTPIAVQRSIIEIASSRTSYYSITTMFRAAAGDYFTLQVNYTNMTSVDVAVGASHSPEFWAMWMGE